MSCKFQDLFRIALRDALIVELGKRRARRKS